MPDDPTDTVAGGYLTTHLREVRDGLGYTRSSYAAKTMATFGDELPAERDATMLEIGPGGCEFAEQLAKAWGYRDVAIVDREPEVIAVAIALGLPAEQVDDVSSYLATQPARWDRVMLFHVLEHVPKRQIIPLLAAIRGSLRPGGRVLIEVPNMGDPFNGIHARYADFTHEVGFTEESLRYVLGQAGFGEVRFLEPVGATGRWSRPLQRVARRILHLALRLVTLPNGRQLRRRIDPVLAVVACP